MASTKIETSLYCSHGCGHIAQYKTDSGSLICLPLSQSCPVLRKINKERALKRHAEIKANKGKAGFYEYSLLPNDIKDKMASTRGKTKITDSRVLNQSLKLLGKRKIKDEEKLDRLLYKELAAFSFDYRIISYIHGYDLLQKYGMYHKILNKEGVVRDHKFSINNGYKLKVNPLLLSHPANCQFLQVKDNARKSCKCSITLDQLILLIDEWSNVI